MVNQVGSLLIRADLEGVNPGISALNRLAVAADRAENATGRLARQTRGTGTAQNTATTSLRTGNATLATRQRLTDSNTVSTRRFNVAIRENASNLRDIAVFSTALGLGGLVAFSNVLRSASGATLEYGRAVAEVGTITDETRIQLLGLEATAESLARTFGGNVVEQVQAFYSAYSAGATGLRSATELVRIANQLAIGGVADLGDAIQLLSTTINAYSETNLSAGRAADLFFVAVRNGITTIPQLSSALATVTPTAAALGVSLDIVTSAVAALTATGTSTATATTNLNALLLSLQRLPEEARNYAASLGILSTSPTEVVDVITQLNRVLLETPSQVERNAILFRLFGSEIRAFRAATSLANGGFSTFTRTLEDSANAVGTASDAFGRLEATDAQRVSSALGTLNSSLLDVGESINVVFVPAFETLAEFISGASENIERFFRVASLGVGLLALRGITGGARALGNRRQTAISNDFDNLQRRRDGFAISANNPNLPDNLRQRAAEQVASFDNNRASFEAASRQQANNGLRQLQTLGVAGGIGATGVALNEVNNGFQNLSTILIGLTLIPIASAFGAIGSSIEKTIPLVANFNRAAVRLAPSLLSFTSLISGGAFGILLGLLAGAVAGFYLYRNSILDADESIRGLTTAHEELSQAILAGDDIARNAAENEVRRNSESLRLAIISLERRAEAARANADDLIAQGGQEVVFGLQGTTSTRIISTEEEREAVRLADQLTEELQEAREIYAGLSGDAINVNENIETAVAFTDMFNDSVIRVRQEFEGISGTISGITEETAKSIARLNGIAPTLSSDRRIIAEERAAIGLIDGQLEGISIREQAVRRLRTTGQTEAGRFAINSNELVSLNNEEKVLQANRLQRIEALESAEARLNAQDAERNKEKVTRINTLADAYDTVLISSITSFATTFSDIFRGAIDTFEDFTEAIGNNFKDLVADLIATAASNQLLLALGFNVVDSNGNLGRATQTNGNIQSNVNSGFASGLAGGASSSLLGGAGGLFSNGLSGATIGTGLSGGFLASLGAVVAPIAAVAIVGAIGASLIGSTRTNGGGFNVNVNNGSVTGNQFRTVRNTGLSGIINGRNRTRDEGALDSGLQGTFQNSIVGVIQGVERATDALGVTFNRNASFSGTVNTFDRTPEQIQQDSETLLANYRNTLTGTIEGLSEFSLIGETSTDTLIRLSTALGDINSSLSLFGFTILDLGLTSADSATRILEATGGSQGFAGGVGRIFAYRSPEEQRSIIEGRIRDALGFIPATEEAFASAFDDALNDVNTATNEADRLTAEARVAAFSNATGAFDLLQQSNRGRSDNLDASRFATDAEFRLAESARRNGGVDLEEEANVLLKRIIRELGAEGTLASILGKTGRNEIQREAFA